MRAAIFHETGGPEVITVEDVPIPEPGPDEVRVRVRASSLNHLDLWARRGLPGVPMPHIGGSDISGTVEVAGGGAGEELIGARVVVDPSLNFVWYERQARDRQGLERFGVIGEHTQGGFAEYAVVPASNVLRLPNPVPFEVAAAAGLCHVTAWRGLVTRAAVQAGDRVLITGGSGGVATAALSIALHLGADVYVVTSGPVNVERVQAMGAERVYDRLSGDWASALWNDTEKTGVDVAFDSVGASAWDACIRSLAVGGRLVTYGATTGPEGRQDIRRVFWKQLSILGTTMGGPSEFRAVMSLVFDGTLRPVIADTLTLEEVSHGHRLLEEGEVFGKLVVRP
jgi:NADPH:quinone reductase-like Zn-dependent oxidoreductase